MTMLRRRRLYFAFLVATLTLPGGLSAARSAPVGLPDTTRTIMLPPALPGAVVTAMVEVPTPEMGRGKARYVVSPAPDVRLFGGTTGLLPAGIRPARVPLTFTLPRNQLAGPLLVATVTLVWEDGVTYRAELRLDVQAQRRMRSSLTAAQVATAGHQLLLQYSVANLGNAPDSVQLRATLPGGWRVPAAPKAILVAPGDTATGVIRVQLPHDATRGDYAVTLNAAGRGDSTVSSVMLHVVAEYSGKGVRIPAKLFLGVPDVRDRRQQPQVALQAEGDVDGTRIALNLRHSDDRIRPPAFYRYTLGPEWSASAENAQWEARAGDVMTPAEGAIGVNSLGTGGSFGWHGRFSGSVFAARPREFGAAPLDGHLAGGQVALASPAGTLGLRLGDYARPLRAGLAEDRTQVAAATYESGPHHGHSVSVEAGFARVAEDTLERSGPTLDASYNFSGSKGAYLTARARRIPGLVQSGQGANDAFVGAGLPLFQGLQLTAWGGTTSIPILGQPANRHSDVAAGLRAGRGPATLQLLGDYGHFDSGASLVTGGVWSQYSVRGTGNLPIGRLSLNATGELGRVDAGGALMPLRSADGRLSLRVGNGSVWLGGNYSEGRFGPMPLMTSAGLQASFGGVIVEGSAGAFVPRVGKPYLGESWASLALPLVFGTGAVLGAEYRPWEPAGSRIRGTAGITMSFGLPLPIPRPPVAEGTVFEDRNGDGRREPEEQALPGIAMRLGAATTTTDAEGRFRFPKGSGRRQDLSVDAAALPLGWLIGSFPARDREVAIPFVRAGSLRLKLIAEETQKSRPDAAGTPVRDIAIELTDSEGRQRGGVSDATGRVFFRALPPGDYTLTVYPVSGRGQPLESKQLPLHIPYGAQREVVLPIPTKPIEIRFKTAAPPTSP